RGVLETGRIVDRDPFIYAARDFFFVNANWAWQVLVAWLDGRTGVAGLVALRTLSIAVAFGAAIWLARRRGASWAGIAPMMVLAGLGGYERFDLRPELASYAWGMLQLFLVLIPPPRLAFASTA